jgi:hypothetical protein
MRSPITSPLSRPGSALSPPSLPWESGGASAPWSPSAIFEAWFRADLGVTHAALEVSAWANSGTAGAPYNTTQGTAGLKPDLIEVDVLGNNRPGVHFDGGDVLAGAVGSYWEIPDGTSFVAYSVFRMEAGAGVKTALATDAFSAGGFAIEPAISATLRCEADDGPTNIRDDGSALVAATLYCVAMVFTAASAPSNDSLEVYTNGTGSGSPTTANLGAIAAGGAQEFLIGAGSAAGAGGLIGTIYETGLIKRLLTAEEDALMTAYLAARYGGTVAF